IEGCEVFSSLEKALAFAKESGETECFIIGGAEVYKQAMPFCKKLYLTSVETTIDGDVFMPPLGDGWVLDSEEKFSADEKNQYATTFKVLSRK
ncbi:MAG: dihydrofolate reductase, partial [Fibrobacteraceae bacterium]|nr:dihydrofolate reductase [Fibrobacteraceae bacterium]